MLNPSRTLGASLLLILALSSCKTEDLPTTWEIIHGTAELTISAAVHPDTRAPIVSYETRTGELTIKDDSTTEGWIKLAAGDTVDLVGQVTRDEGTWYVTFDDLLPAEYKIITNGEFAGVYGLVSTSVLTSNIVGDATPENYRVYWQFER